jgi:hypothetical protein
MLPLPRAGCGLAGDKRRAAAGAAAAAVLALNVLPTLQTVGAPLPGPFATAG